MPTITLNSDEFEPRYATRIDTNGHPVKVRVDLTPILAAIAEENRTKLAKIAWRDTTRENADGAIWGLAQVTPIRPDVTDELRAA